ncbi:hypothetical protein, partial [Planococcus sp. CP5-4_UN]|uniref:hypothetical protein n=1 Tax=Planococcus sp. CP5-4_UN TaxID=2850852 RepID=UPI001C2C0D5D
MRLKQNSATVRQANSRYLLIYSSKNRFPRFNSHLLFPTAAKSAIMIFYRKYKKILAAKFELVYSETTRFGDGVKN